MQMDPKEILVTQSSYIYVCVCVCVCVCERERERERERGEFIVVSMNTHSWEAFIPS
jgi:hypothetical protein